MPGQASAVFAQVARVVKACPTGVVARLGHLRQAPCQALVGQPLARVPQHVREQLGDPKTYDEVSPRRFAAKADAPVLLIHGRDDTVVGYKQSQVMAAALKDAGKPYELVDLAGEDHWLSREETRKRMLSETMRFVQKHNPAQ